MTDDHDLDCRLVVRTTTGRRTGGTGPARISLSGRALPLIGRGGTVRIAGRAGLLQLT